ncbi:MAG: bifunctional folylpolyglutamate synthase/dihydrofolate synthase [Bacteroidales bacterium]|nr:bifunctional folylpolyglutamate synthase/dihydrofolate synthase [Bacteroidales bacterium]
MNYSETLSYLYAQLPVFESQGAHAYKPGLERCEAMDELLGHPHRRFRTIHVAGTNGKGSTSHLLAAILQAAGYRVGLFTSPHLVDFSERIRVDGQEIDHTYVVEWVSKWAPAEAASQCDSTSLMQFQPSFFELATMMAFCYFADQKVDVAIIEVGLGGRLDSTNIIRPVLSIITNISLDHTQFLGDTLPQIAAEKAGIMKKGVPCVIGECEDERVRFTFEQNAQLRQVSELDFACDRPQIPWVRHHTFYNIYETADDGTLQCPLCGDCQPRNANTVITAVHQLRKLGFDIPQEALEHGFRDVVTLTHLRGRWETLQTNADGSIRVLCDTGHNPGCFAYLGPQLKALHQAGNPLQIVFGMVSDKDITTVLRMLPPSQPAAPAVNYYWCNAPTPRALPASELAEKAASVGLEGQVFPSIDAALDAALQQPGIVFVGGSNYVVCEALSRF